MKFAKFLRTNILKNICERLLLVVVHVLIFVLLMNHLFLLASTVMITKKKSFSCFHGNHCLGKKFHHQNHTAYKSKLFPKNKRRKTAQEKLLRRCDFYHFIIPEKFSIGLTRLVFLKSSWWSVWIFRAQELPKGTILSSIILCLAIFKEQFSVAAPSTECL